MPNPLLPITPGTRFTLYTSAMLYPLWVHRVYQAQTTNSGVVYHYVGVEYYQQAGDIFHLVFTAAAI